MNKRLRRLALFVCLICLCAVTFGALPYSVNKVYADTEVYLGGNSIGLIARTEGVIVTAVQDVMTEKGAVSPSKDAGMMVGDIITAVDSVSVKNEKEVVKAVANGKNSVILSVIRKGERLNVSVKPALDMINNTKRLGLGIKNDITGIGTLTFISADGKRFGGLGHAISDGETGLKYEFNNGEMYECIVLGIVKGGEKPGSIRGRLSRSKPIGKLTKNTKFGIYGSIDTNIDSFKRIATATRKEIKMGDAKILTTIDDKAPQYFDIEIIKTEAQGAPDDKSMVIRVIDKRLISATGGIVQGMSGSPIIQNGKLVGAVTHVFLNDSTKGYGIYIDWMLAQI